MVDPALSWLAIHSTGSFRTRTRREYWDVVDIRPKDWGSSFPGKAIDLNRFRRFRVRVRVPRRWVRESRTSSH